MTLEEFRQQTKLLPSTTELFVQTLRGQVQVAYVLLALIIEGKKEAAK